MRGKASEGLKRHTNRDARICVKRRWHKICQNSEINMCKNLLVTETVTPAKRRNAGNDEETEARNDGKERGPD